jgi:hypothetical protein
VTVEEEAKDGERKRERKEERKIGARINRVQLVMQVLYITHIYHPLNHHHPSQAS